MNNSPLSLHTCATSALFIICPRAVQVLLSCTAISLHRRHSCNSTLFRSEHTAEGSQCESGEVTEACLESRCSAWPFWQNATLMEINPALSRTIWTLNLGRNPKADAQERRPNSTSSQSTTQQNNLRYRTSSCVFLGTGPLPLSASWI